MIKEVKQDGPEEAKKKKQIDLGDIAKVFMKAFSFLKQHLVLLFIVLTLSALMYAVITVNNIIQQPASLGHSESSRTNSGSFDKSTIEKINTLSDPNQTPNVAIPPGRVNPFYE